MSSLEKGAAPVATPVAQEIAPTALSAAPKAASEQPWTPVEGVFSDTKFVDNLSQIVVRTTEDRLRRFLGEFRESVSATLAWAFPFGSALSLCAALATASFRDLWGKKAEFWDAFFTFLFIASVIWTSIAAYKAIGCRKAATLEFVICRIKNEPAQISLSSPMPDDKLSWRIRLRHLFTGR